MLTLPPSPGLIRRAALADAIGSDSGAAFLEWTRARGTADLGASCTEGVEVDIPKAELGLMCSSLMACAKLAEGGRALPAYDSRAVVPLALRRYAERIASGAVTAIRVPDNVHGFAPWSMAEVAAGAEAEAKRIESGGDPWGW